MDEGNITRDIKAIRKVNFEELNAMHIYKDGQLVLEEYFRLPCPTIRI